MARDDTKYAETKFARHFESEDCALHKKGINTKHRLHQHGPQPAQAKKTGVAESFLRFLGYLGAVAVLIFISLADNKPPSPQHSSEKGIGRWFEADFWYENAMGRPERPAKYVAVVTYGMDMPTIAQNPILGATTSLSVSCQRRIYLAELLRSLANYSPAVVVMDIWLEPRNCSDSQATQALLTEVSHFPKPVVFGIGSYDEAELRANFPAEFAAVSNRKPAFKSTELVRIPSLVLPSTFNISTGVVELNADNRKIPLSWPVYDDFSKVGEKGQPQQLDTIAIAAVRAFDPQNESLKRIGALNPDGSPKASREPHPYTSFLREEDLPVARAIDLICSHPSDEYWRSTCKDLKPMDVRPDAITGRIIFVGQSGPGPDVHQSLIGDVPGVILQANYVESLLDGRVFKPMRSIYQILLGLVWLGSMFWLTRYFRPRPALAFVLSVLAAVIPAYLIHLLILRFNYYTHLLLPLILAAIVINISLQLETFVAREEEHP